MVKNPFANAGNIRDAGSFPGPEGPLEEGMTTHSNILAWRIPMDKEPGGLQSMGWQRVGHDRNTSSFLTTLISDKTSVLTTNVS